VVLWKRTLAVRRQFLYLTQYPYSEDGEDVHGSSDDDEDDEGSMAREAVP
jgi:hypothetical protein